MTRFYYPPSVGPAPTGPIPTTSFKTRNIPVSPAEMWELHHGGFVKNYEVHGTNTFTLTWNEGQSFENAVISNET